jgi:transcriptional regulator with XRE-family HTH domain
MNTSWDAIGRRMQITRLALGLTEQEAATAWRLTLRTYRKWEAGAPQRGSNFLCFAEKYDISLDWLLGGDAARLGRHLTARAKGKVAILPIGQGRKPLAA